MLLPPSTTAFLTRPCSSSSSSATSTAAPAPTSFRRCDAARLLGHTGPCPTADRRAVAPWRRRPAAEAGRAPNLVLGWATAPVAEAEVKEVEEGCDFDSLDYTDEESYAELRSSNPGPKKSRAQSAAHDFGPLVGT